MDASGAVVPGAPITCLNNETNFAAQRTSDGSGNYQCLELVPGSYSISVAAAHGFKKLERTGITVHVDDRLTIDLTLQVGEAKEVVSVSADASQIRTEDAQTGEVVNNVFIENLPQLQRDPLALITLSADVGGDGSRAGNIITLGTPGLVANGRSDTTINGGRTSGLDYIVDGLSASTGRAHSVSTMTPTMDAVDEFKVITNGISAEYGRISGGAVELVTKSGTNAYHGQLFEYLQNTDLNANSWQNNELGAVRAPFGNNDFGFTLGGPVIIPKVYNGRNKTFFFVNYEGLRFRESGVQEITSVPTQAERSGDYTQSYYGCSNLALCGAQMWDPNGSSIYNASVGLWQRTTLLGGNGMIVPAADISPVSAAILKFVPMPNTTPPLALCNACENYEAPQNEKKSSNTTAVRLDQYITQNQRLSLRFSAGGYSDALSAWQGPATSAPETQINGARFGTINYTWTASPTLLFDVRGSVHHDPYTGGSLLPASFSNTNIGFDPFTQSILGPNNIMAIQVFAAGQDEYYGTSAAEQVLNSTSYEMNIGGTKVLGRHTLKFGYDMRRYYDNILNTASGQTSFLPDPIGLYAQDNAIEFGHGFAEGVGSFLMGTNDYAQISAGYSVAMDTNYHAAYIQDDFKVNRKLTLNLGVRWDYEMSPTERHNKLYLWDPNAPSPFQVNSGYSYTAALAAAGINPSALPYAPSWVANGFPKGGIEIAGTSQWPSRTPTSPNPHQFAPRVGFAYQLDPKTVVRGSFGMMYLPTTGDPYSLVSGGSGVSLADAGSAGWHASNDNMLHLISNWANPFPSPGMITYYTRSAQEADIQAPGTTGPEVYDSTQHQPYELTWNIGVQRELPGHFLVESYYTANRGIGLLGNNLISRYPKDLFTPQYENTMTTPVASPTAGQTLSNAVVGPTQYLAFLYYPYPYFGPVNLLGANIGRSSYNAWIIKARRNFANGFSFLFNYTMSRLLDDVGGPELDTIRITDGGVGYKSAQSVDSVVSTWGLSPLDQKSRISATYTYELPVGRGKKFLNNTGNTAGAILDGIVGGWALSGVTTFRSGTPIVITGANTNSNNNIRVEWTYGSYATPCTMTSCLENSAFTSNSQVLYSPNANIPANAVTRFNDSAIIGVQPFTYGTLPPITNIRNPSNNQTDLSLMKKFNLAGEKRFIQLRVEAINAFNIRGFGLYDSGEADAHFGLITSPGNVERHVQVSARIVF